MGNTNFDHAHCFCTNNTAGRPVCCKCGLTKPAPAVMYFKGQTCWLNTGILCQEGYCSDCGIYYDNYPAAEGGDARFN